MADSSLSLRRAWAACLSARGRERALPLLKLNVPSDCFFTIRTKPRLLDPVFRPFQIKFKAETNPVSTVHRSFLCSPQLNCILTPVLGAAEPLDVVRKAECLPLTSHGLAAQLTPAPASPTLPRVILLRGCGRVACTCFGFSFPWSTA